MKEKSYTTKQLKTAVLDLLDMHGALCGGPHQLEGFGITDERQEELWELGQQLLKEKDDLEWT